MTLDELDRSLPNGFHDAEMRAFELDYVAGVAKFHLNLLIGWPEDLGPDRQAHQEATLIVSGLCFCSIHPPCPTYPFITDGKPILMTGSQPKIGVQPFATDLVARFPPGTWCYHFFVDDWNACINIAGQDATVTWIGEKPKHAV